MNMTIFIVAQCIFKHTQFTHQQMHYLLINSAFVGEWTAYISKWIVQQ